MRSIRYMLAGATALAVIIGLALLPQPHSSAQASVPRMASATEALAGSSRHIAEVGNVTTYEPQGPVRGVVLFLSGDGGWNLGVVDMARALNQQGVAVAGFSTPAFLKSLEANHDRCINPNFALTALAQDVEHKMGLPHYIKPILAGYSSGATIVYAALVQAPAGTYRGAVSLGFGPDINGTKPWCAASGLAAAPITKPEKGWLFSTVPHLSAPWLVLQGMDDQVVSPANTRAFTSRIPEAQLIELPRVGHGFSVQSHWMPQFSAAFTPMLEAPETARTASRDPATASVDDLPLNLVINARAPRSNTMAVMYSGDGGWAGLDRDMAARLAASGIPVIGVDSLDYFWNAKSPAQAGSDLGRIISHFSQQWQRPRVILLGYSFGADDLPFIVNAMPPTLKPAIARLSMLGLDQSADFQFHLDSWLDVSGANSLPTLPEIERTRDISMQCIRGDSETDSACLTIPSGVVRQVVLPGGHHFGGNANAVVAAVLDGVKT